VLCKSVAYAGSSMLQTQEVYHRGLKGKLMADFQTVKHYLQELHLAIVKEDSAQHILIVEDDLNFQFALQCCLKKEGYSCIGAVSVEEALKSVRLSVPDIVILDLGLRQASGIAFLQNFRKAVSSGEKIPPVLVVSGHSDPEIVEFVTMLGASRFIPKPIGASEIALAVRSFIH